MNFHRTYLVSLSENCAKEHSAYVAALRLSEEQRLRADSWLLEIDLATTSTFQVINDYLARRADDTASSVASRRSLTSQSRHALPNQDALEDELIPDNLADDDKEEEDDDEECEGKVCEGKGT